MLVSLKRLSPVVNSVDFLCRVLYPFPQEIFNVVEDGKDFKVDFVKKVAPGEWLCYEHQQSISVVDLGLNWGFIIRHVNYPDINIAKERAICILHNQFYYQPDPAKVKT